MTESKNNENENMNRNYNNRNSSYQRNNNFNNDISMNNNHNNQNNQNQNQNQNQNNQNNANDNKMIICSFHRDFIPEIDDLYQYFQKFGQITNKVEIEYDTKKVPLAKIKFSLVYNVNLI